MHGAGHGHIRGIHLAHRHPHGAQQVAQAPPPVSTASAPGRLAAAGQRQPPPQDSVTVALNDLAKAKQWKLKEDTGTGQA